MATSVPCPSCQSTDTATLWAIYEHGTADISGAGMEIGLGGGGGVAEFSGTQVSRAAARAAPPVKKDEQTPMLVMFGLIGLNVIAVLLIFSINFQKNYSGGVAPYTPFELFTKKLVASMIVTIPLLALAGVCFVFSAGHQK